MSDIYDAYKHYIYERQLVELIAPEVDGSLTHRWREETDEEYEARLTHANLDPQRVSKILSKLKGRELDSL